MDCSLGVREGALFGEMVTKDLQSGQPRNLFGSLYALRSHNAKS